MNRAAILLKLCKPCPRCGCHAIDARVSALADRAATDNKRYGDLRMLYPAKIHCRRCGCMSFGLGLRHPDDMRTEILTDIDTLTEWNDDKEHYAEWLHRYEEMLDNEGIDN